MREFLLLPVYVVLAALAVLLLVFGALAALAALSLFLASIAVELAFVRLGFARHAEPLVQRQHAPWWQEDEECWKAAQERQQGDNRDGNMPGVFRS